MPIAGGWLSLLFYLYKPTSLLCTPPTSTPINNPAIKT